VAAQGQQPPLLIQQLARQSLALADHITRLYVYRGSCTKVMLTAHILHAGWQHGSGKPGSTRHACLFKGTVFNLVSRQQLEILHSDNSRLCCIGSQLHPGQIADRSRRAFKTLPASPCIQEAIRV
jgi:hypothetical protein